MAREDSNAVLDDEFVVHLFFGKDDVNLGKAAYTKSWEWDYTLTQLTFV